jgi:hypothetical protein
MKTIARTGDKVSDDIRVWGKKLEETKTRIEKEEKTIEPEQVKHVDIWVENDDFTCPISIKTSESGSTTPAGEFYIKVGKIDIDIDGVKTKKFGCSIKYKKSSEARSSLAGDETVNVTVGEDETDKRK